MTDDDRDCTDPPSTFHLNLPDPIQVNGASSKRGFSILSPTYRLLYYLFMATRLKKIPRCAISFNAFVVSVAMLLPVCFRYLLHFVRCSTLRQMYFDNHIVLFFLPQNTIKLFLLQ